MKKRAQERLLLAGKGMAMGAADVVPGVSGGTIALITGVYEKLIHSINSINLQAFHVLRQKGFRSAWNFINGDFLLTLFIGIGISIVSLAKLITYLLEHHPIPVWGFFFGLILASSFSVGDRVKKWRFGPVLGTIAGTALAYFITLLPPLAAVPTNGFIFLSGMIAICAMILPGISGSFILLLLGSYSAVLNAIKEIEIITLGSFAMGCIIGLLAFSRLLNWMFQRYHDMTIGVMTGFLIGSLNKVWPWKSVVETRMVDGEEKVILEENVLPDTFALTAGQDPHTFKAIFLAVLGALLVFLVEKLGRTDR